MMMLEEMALPTQEIMVKATVSRRPGTVQMPMIQDYQESRILTKLTSMNPIKLV